MKNHLTIESSSPRSPRTTTPVGHRTDRRSPAGRLAALAMLAAMLGGCAAAADQDSDATTVSGQVTAGGGTRTTLYIHGRSTDSRPVDWSYWVKARPGVNAVAVNWSGTDRIADSNGVVRAALDRYCTGNNWCYVACHSAGCAQIGYSLSLYGTTAAGDRWNIYWIAAAGSAEGGSELADTGRTLGVGVALDEDLKTSVMRNLYDHDNSAGVPHYMFAGDGWSDNYLMNAAAALFSGAEDMAVAYHSAGAVNNTTFATQKVWCNATDSSCNGSVLDTGKAANIWSLHTVQYLDAARQYSHYITDSDEGICSRMFAFVADNAK